MRIRYQQFQPLHIQQLTKFVCLCPILPAYISVLFPQYVHLVSETVHVIFFLQKLSCNCIIFLFKSSIIAVKFLNFFQQVCSDSVSRVSCLLIKVLPSTYSLISLFPLLVASVDTDGLTSVNIQEYIQNTTTIVNIITNQLIQKCHFFVIEMLFQL